MLECEGWWVVQSGAPLHPLQPLDWKILTLHPARRTIVSTVRRGESCTGEDPLSVPCAALFCMHVLSACADPRLGHGMSCLTACWPRTLVVCMCSVEDGEAAALQELVRA